MEHGKPRPRVRTLVQDELWRAPGLAAARAIPNRETGFFYQDISNPQAFSVYEDVIRGTAICDLLKRLTTGEAWFVGEQVFLKEGSTPATGWHQDISDFPASGDNLFVLWIPFDPVDEATSLGLVQGSHRGPIYSSIYQSYKGKARPRSVEHVSFACEPGDIVVFHMGCMHGGAPTRANQTRRALALRFIGDDVRFSSRTREDDPRNGKLFRNPTMRRII